MDWKIKEHAVPVGTRLTMDDLAAITIKNRMDAMYAEVERNMKSNLFADMMKSYVPPTRWERWRALLRVFPERVRDAWLVLKGEAEIGRDY